MNHEAAAPALEFRCPRVEAVFAGEGVRLGNEAPAPLLCDEHGGTYVLRVEGLKLLNGPGPGAGGGIRLEVALPAPEALLAAVESFAGRHRLALPSGAPPPELTLPPILTACHVPEKNLFVYSEDSLLRVRAGAGHTVELTVTGEFRARQLPCRDLDVVIHLRGPDISRLLSFLAALAR